MFIEVKVKPGTGRSELVQVKQNRLEFDEKDSKHQASSPRLIYIAYLKSKPEKGKANAELLNLLYRAFPKAKEIKIVRGLKSRKKRIKLFF